MRIKMQELNDILLKKLNFTYVDDRTHMPFVFYEKNGSRSMLFDIRFGQLWKLYCYQNGEIFKIDTPSKDEFSSECNGMLYKKDGLYHISYTRNFLLENSRTMIYGVGKDLKNIEWISQFKYPVSLLNEKYVAEGIVTDYCGSAYINFYNHNNTDINKCVHYKNQVYRLESHFHFAKMGFISGKPDKIIITYAPEDKRYNGEGSVLIDLKKKTVKDIRLKNGNSAYKASIDPKTNECFYALRKSGFECRSIEYVKKEEYDLVDTRKVYFVE